MKSALVIGNCQATPPTELLNVVCENVTFTAVPPVHLITPDEVDRLFGSLDKYQFFITQPISREYRNGIGVGAESIRAKLAPAQRLLLFPNLHFEGFFPTWGYLGYDDRVLNGAINLSRMPVPDLADDIAILQKSDYHDFLRLV